MPYDDRKPEFIVPVLPAFMAYERALCDFLRQNVIITSDSGRVEDIRVEYAGGERAERAIRAANDPKVNRNQRDRQNMITIKLADVEYNAERYHPPESYWNVIGNANTPDRSTQAARVSKGAPFRCSYDVNIYTLYEGDLRYVINALLMKFHYNGGIAYLEQNVFGGPHAKLIPIFLRGYSHNVTSEAGEEERVVRASLMLEMETYLPLPMKFQGVFRRYIQETFMASGTPGVFDHERMVTDSEGSQYNVPSPTIQPPDSP